MRDPKTGAIKRGRYRTLKLDELSGVTVPAQEGALAVIMKTAESPLLKYLCTEGEAKTFAELLEASEKERRAWAANEKVWPAISAVTDSIRSIIGDREIDWASKQEMLRQTVESFLAEVREKAPDIEAELNKYLDEGVLKMSDIEKKLADAEAALAKANADLATVTKERDDAIAKAAKSEKEKGDAEEAMEEMKKRGDDEVLKIGDVEVRKSVVGDAAFAIHKAQNDALAKANDKVEFADFKKQADDNYGHLPGTTDERANVLKAMGAMPEDARKALGTILTAAEKMAAAGFENLGHRDPEIQSNLAKAKSDFNAEVQNIRKRDGIAEHQAIQKARVEHPALWDAFYDAQQAANVPAV